MADKKDKEKKKKKTNKGSSRKSEVKLDKKREKISGKADTRKRKTRKKDIEKSREASVSPNAVLPVNRRRIAFGFGVILLLMFALMIRMGYWQIVRADELRVMATEMQKVDSEIDPARGSIYDSRMNILAESVTEYELYAYSQQLYKSDEITAAEKASVIKILNELTDKNSNELQKILSGDENLVLVADGLTKEKVDKAKEVFDSDVVIKTKTARSYPNGAFAAQILGGVDASNTGRSGLEYQYNSELAGVKGRTVMTTDRNGDTVSNSSRYFKAKDGVNIVTTIDSVIQNFVEDALETGMQETGADAITCIVMDPKAGDILAAATTPEFDPNKSNEPSDESEKKLFDAMSDKEKSDYLSRMWTIRGVSDVYEPGSTFKMIAAAAALDSASADDSSEYDCSGSIKVADYNLHCLYVHGHEDLNEAVGNSCNTAMAEVAMDMGAKTFYDYIDMFGFNDKTGVDLPGETDSIVKNPDDMSIVDLATTGYGQGIAITPIQILSAMNVFGNDGYLMKPKIVKKILDQNGKTVKEFEDVKVRQVLSEPTVEKMKDIMEYYVSDGGGTTAYIPGYRVGGKTGTANFVEGSGYSSGTNTSFAVMAPMDDPKISMICIVYRPRKKEFGAFTAGPIVKEITENTLQYMGVEKVYSKSEENEQEKSYVKVPDVTGDDSSTAVSKITYEELDCMVMPETDSGKSFVVVDQYPKAGTKVEKNSVVYIYSE